MRRKGSIGTDTCSELGVVRLLLFFYSPVSFMFPFPFPAAVVARTEIIRIYLPFNKHNQWNLA